MAVKEETVEYLQENNLVDILDKINLLSKRKI
jgi:hypothetical protein